MPILTLNPGDQLTIAIPESALDRAALIDAAVEATLDGSLRDGPWSDELKRQLAERGLVIVEASKWDAATTALNIIGSMPPDETAYSPDAVASYAACMAKVAGDAVRKLRSP